MAPVPQWTMYENMLTSMRVYARPFVDVSVQILVTTPSGRTFTRDAFWDGQQVWRFRLRADEVGHWQWRTVCSNLEDSGLHAIAGEFECESYNGQNQLYVRGSLQLAPNHRYFEYAGGEPFFWLGDTCWNGVLRSTAGDWEEYLTTRHQQGFNVIQFISTNWRALSKDPFGEAAFELDDPACLNPAFFQRLDPRVAAINAHGLIAAPILIHDNGAGNFGAALPEADVIRLARYLVARWGAYHIAFTLGADGQYYGERAERWLRIGQGVFGDQPFWPVTVHPEGLGWIGPQLQLATWLNFIGYQSGHGDQPEDMRWHTTGPASTEWRSVPTRPFINVELNYELHPSFQTKTPFTSYAVRRAFYWSLLISPTAGATYGHQYIWPWNDKPAPTEGHDDFGYGIIPIWREGLHTEGAAHIILLRQLFDTLEWWRLAPAPHLVRYQPGKANAAHYIAAACNDTNTLALVYIPVGGEVQLSLNTMQPPLSACWFNPRTGERTDVESLNQTEVTFATLDSNDWLLLITKW